MDTSRKIPEQEILMLDELEIDLKRSGIRTTQKELLCKAIRLLVQHKSAVEQELGGKKDNTREMTERFLRHAKKYDLGNNWLEEIDTTL